MIINRKREEGFTLIELLVVIAIIGILSSVVLASLNTARGKGNDAKVKAQLSGLRAAVEIYYDNNNGYGVTTDSCSSGMFSDTTSGMNQYTLSSNYPNGATLSCHSNGSDYAVSAVMPGTAAGANDNWCVDSRGASKTIDAPLTNGTYQCP